MKAEIEIIALAVFGALWCMAMLRNFLYRRVLKLLSQASAKPLPPSEILPPLSVVLPAHEQVDALRKHLPSILEQEYPESFEVIVVDMNSTDDTQDYLKSIEKYYPHLHVVRTPSSARNVSPIRLALTLGIRAASHEWVVITQPNCSPASPNWLLRMGQACTEREGVKVVLGHTRISGSRGWNGLRFRFFRLWQQVLHLPYAHRHGGYRAEGTNLCYHRSLFLQHRGFADHSNLLAGATDIMVNRQSTHKNTTICLHPDAFVTQDCSQNVLRWGQERLFFMDTRSHFQHWVLYRLKYMSHVWLTWMYTLSTLFAVGLCIWLEDYLPLGTVAFLWLLHAIYRAICFKQITKAFGEPSLTFSLPLLLHLVAWWDTTAWLRWLFTKKRTFQKKFI